MELNGFEDLFAYGPVPLLVVSGPELHIEHANRAAHDLLGGENVAGKSLVTALPELEKQGCIPWLLDSLQRAGLQAYGEPLQRSSPVGTTSYWTLLCRRIEDGRGAMQGIVALVDETAHRVARRELEMHAARASAENRTKDRFMAMLSHELRHPISPIVQSLELMRLQGMHTPEQAVIERQIEHLSRLTNDLLDLARIARGTFGLEQRLLRLEAIVGDAVEMVEPLLSERRQRVQVDIPKGLCVNVDRDRMCQVLANLLTNAAKYSDTHSEIVVSATRHQRKILLSVIDRGLGMTPAKLARLFDPDCHETEAGLSDGLGLGLVIVRQLVRQHGGDVHAYSDGPGRGSQFVIELPSANLDKSGRTPVADSMPSWSDDSGIEARNTRLAGSKPQATRERIAAAVS
jgi:signal transduction histidine kinase